MTRDEHDDIFTRLLQKLASEIEEEGCNFINNIRLTIDVEGFAPWHGYISYVDTTTESH